MAEYLIQDTTLDAIADAINAKTGGSSAMTPAQMVTAIGSISGGGGIQSANGEIVFAGQSADPLIVSGLSFKPNAFIVISDCGLGKTVGGYAFCGLFSHWIRINQAGQFSSRNTIIKWENMPNDTFAFDSLGDGDSTTNYQFFSDGFRLATGWGTNYPFESGTTYYWKAWRFE